MSTIGIIAEFNPFHNGHFYLINECKKQTGADKCIVIMSGDFVQRGVPSITDKFSRARMALSCGADLCIELPVYYSTGSAEFFAKGAVSILDKLGTVDYLCFGSECGDIDAMSSIASILNDEPDVYKKALLSELKKGSSFACSREKAIVDAIKSGSLGSDSSSKEKALTASKVKDIISAPNNILAVEYIKALMDIGSDIRPFTIKRIGDGYNCDVLSNVPSATAIRNVLNNNDCPKEDLIKTLNNSVPSAVLNILSSEETCFVHNNDVSELLHYKLIQNAVNGYEEYLDVTSDISNKIIRNLDKYNDFDDFCMKLKSKDITYSRISRVLTHILLDIKSSNMVEYANDSFTGYVRILGQKSSAKDLLARIQKNGKLPVLNRLKDAPDKLNTLQMRLFEETLNSSKVYNIVNKHGYQNEYRLKPVIM